MIRAERLAYAFGPGAPALAEVAFAVEPGMLLGVVGANGSGKSTLLALVAGILTPTGGATARTREAGAVGRRERGPGPGPSAACRG